MSTTASQPKRHPDQALIGPPARRSPADAVNGGRDPTTGRFGPGNPGRLKGSRNKATLLAQAMLEEEAENITRYLIDLGMAGDTRALRICATRLLPTKRDHPVEIDLPEIATAQDALRASGRITALVAGGELTPEQGLKLSAIVDNHRRALETADLEKRIAALEALAREETP